MVACMVYFTYVWLICMVHVGIQYMDAMAIGVIKRQQTTKPKHHERTCVNPPGTRRPGL